MVGAPYEATNGLDSGAAYVVSGQTWARLHTKRGSAAFEYEGWTVAGGGDWNADGKADFASYSFGDDMVRVWSGNSGTATTNFLGTTDGQALDFRVGNKRALRLEPTSSSGTVNVIGGSAVNFVAAGIYGATIGGGGNGAGSPPNMRFPNSVNQNFGTIAGGANNQVNSLSSSIGGGDSNHNLAQFAVGSGGGPRYRS